MTKATFAAGCFWGVEEILREIPHADETELFRLCKKQAWEESLSDWFYRFKRALNSFQGS